MAKYYVDVAEVWFHTYEIETDEVPEPCSTDLRNEVFEAIKSGNRGVGSSDYGDILPECLWHLRPQDEE